MHPAQPRKAIARWVFIGGTGTGKTHLAIAIARQALRSGFRVRFFNLVDLANQLEQEKLAGKGGRLSDRLSRYTELVVLDELGYLPFSKNGGQLVFHAYSGEVDRSFRRCGSRPLALSAGLVVFTLSDPLQSSALAQ